MDRFRLRNGPFGNAKRYVWECCKVSSEFWPFPVRFVNAPHQMYTCGHNNPLRRCRDSSAVPTKNCLVVMSGNQTEENQNAFDSPQKCLWAENSLQPFAVDTGKQMQSAAETCPCLSVPRPKSRFESPSFIFRFLALLFFCRGSLSPYPDFFIFQRDKPIFRFWTRWWHCWCDCKPQINESFLVKRLLFMEKFLA